MNIDPNQIRQIVLLGCGGTGSHVAAGLARLEIAIRALGGKFPRVLLCDPDVVEAPNVGRQLFSHAEIGLPKATALAQRINLSYGLQWEASQSDSQGCLNLVCVDSRRARRKIYDAASPHALFLDFGNTSNTGQVIFGGGEIPLPHRQFPRLADLRYKDDHTPSCSLAEALESQELFVNQMMATYGLQMLWSIFRRGALKCQGYFINLDGSAHPYHIK